jgi:hypothetical protein
MSNEKGAYRSIGRCVVLIAATVQLESKYASALLRKTNTPDEVLPAAIRTETVEHRQS